MGLEAGWRGILLEASRSTPGKGAGPRTARQQASPLLLPTGLRGDPGPRPGYLSRLLGPPCGPRCNTTADHQVPPWVALGPEWQSCKPRLHRPGPAPPAVRPRPQDPNTVGQGCLKRGSKRPAPIWGSQPRTGLESPLSLAPGFTGLSPLVPGTTFSAHVRLPLSRRGLGKLTSEPQGHPRVLPADARCGGGGAGGHGAVPAPPPPPGGAGGHTMAHHPALAHARRARGGGVEGPVSGRCTKASRGRGVEPTLATV